MKKRKKWVSLVAGSWISMMVGKKSFIIRLSNHLWSRIKTRMKVADSQLSFMKSTSDWSTVLRKNANSKSLTINRATTLQSTTSQPRASKTYSALPRETNLCHQIKKSIPLFPQKTKVKTPRRKVKVVFNWIRERNLKSVSRPSSNFSNKVERLWRVVKSLEQRKEQKVLLCYFTRAYQWRKSIGSLRIIDNQRVWKGLATKKSSISL